MPDKKFKEIKVYLPAGLLERRNELGLTQKALAVIMGLKENSYKMISAYELGNDEHMLTSLKSWEALQNYEKEINND